MRQFFSFIGAQSLAFLKGMGEVTILMLKTILSCRSLRRRGRIILREMVGIGVNAVPIGSVMAFFMGMVLALQTGVQLDLYGLKNLMGSIVGMSLVKELAPVFMALLVAGRAGSAMAAELGSMAVSEEILALRSMGIDPVNFLVMPKFVAACMMLPVLVVIATLCGFFGGALMSYLSVGLDYDTFFEALYRVLKWDDHIGSLIKSFVFGGTIAIISCHQGLTTEGGPQEVGASTTSAVVLSFMAVFIFDTFITKTLIIIF